MCLARIALLTALLGLTLAASSAETPAFTKPPTATRSGDKTTIAFAVNQPADVAVFIEDAKGKVIRHLVAGVLGKNPPAPLKPNVLEQAVEWDGKADYGKDAGTGPFKVRIALGLGAKYDKILAHDPQNFGNIRSLATGPDGTLYICCSFGGDVANWGGERILALDRAGKYQRTVIPFASNLKKEEAGSLGVAELNGQIVPLVKAVIPRSFYSSESQRKGGMAVTKDGVLVRAVGGYNGRGQLSISALNQKGTPAWGAELGPKLLELARPSVTRPFICVSADGQWAYVTGLGEVRPGQKPSDVRFASVYRVPLPARGPATPFIGKPEEPGTGEGQLSANPRGLALDGKGHLLIADHANNRVVVAAEADGKFVAQFPVENPDGLAVDQATGAVYVSRIVRGGAMELVKFSGWKDAKALAKANLPSDGDPANPWVLALDATAKPAIVWMGSDGATLLRFEDQGDKLAQTKINTGEFGHNAYIDLNVDRFRAEPEIYARIGSGHFLRFAEGSDKPEFVRTGTAINEGVCILPGPDGNLYGLGYPCNFFRYDRNGKPNPWPAGSGEYPADQKKKPPAHAMFVPVSMVFMTHTLGIRQDGRIFIFEPGHVGGRPPKMLREYTLEGKRVSDTPIIWKVSDAAIGPKFDAQGNIYIAEQVKPLDQPVPPEFASIVGPVQPEKTYLANQPEKDALCTMYGSIVKFSPKGGMIHYGEENPFKGEPKLDPALKTVEMGYYNGYRFKPVKVTGAEWVKMGVSHVDLHYCNCENIRFDVDEFGRVWFPDTARFRVGVIDTNGNDLAHFGGYGTADNRGPESKDKALAIPDLAFSWLVSVGVTDKYLYTGDSLNRRLLRAKLTYAAEASCEIK